MKKLLIIGAGPRGLAIALQALQYNLDIILLDPSPISTWTPPNIINDMYMRSPITFDLTTFNKELYNFSLPKFLNKDIAVFTQEEVESIPLFCSRTEFKNYLNFIILYLKNQGIKFYREYVHTIDFNKVLTKSNNEFYFDYIVIASGRETQELKYPCYLNSNNIIPNNKLYFHKWNNKKVYVVGSGQQSAEYVYYLTNHRANVTWIQKYTPKVNQYPIPSYLEWGSQTALGNFYIQQALDKNIYLKNVKDWMPSITPYIANKLKEVKYDILFNPTTTNNIDTTSKFILATGYNQNIDKINFNFDLARDKINNYLPSIIKDFQSSSNSNIYFTGLLAARYDGPRQGSIISAADTATTILNSILN